MSDNVPAEEIADDFRHSLEYLQNPDRYAINNFTVIAKENTEHADAISNVLIEHIRKAPPHHKLPALYVLDSIAKNIGTPYSLFLGHKLYSAFMGAYSSVDPTTRKKLDEMLKTWKSPVPGSIDPTPVFPPEITKRIENALIQAKTVALKHDQTQNQSAFHKRPNSALAATQWRNTPTPPAQNLQFTPPLLHSQHAVTQTVPYGVSVSQSNLSAFPHSSTTPLSNPFYSQDNSSNPMSIYNNTVLGTLPPFLNAQGGQLHLQQYGQVPSRLNDMNALHHDIDRLIESCRHGYSFGYTEQQRSSKLQALVALKEVLSTQSLPSEQLVVVRRQVDELQAIERRENSEKQTVSTPPPFPFAAPAPPSNFSSTPLPARIASGVEAFPTSESATPNLAALLARVTAEPPAHSIQPKTPTMVQGGSDRESTAGMSSLLASLAEQGVFLQIEGEQSRDSDTRSSTTILNGSVADLLARATKSNPDANEVPLKLSSSSLKLARPDRLKIMLQKRPSQCVNCGLRFTSTEDGKRRKEQHMDWHFQANQRISDAAKGIQSRSWFVGELEWINSKELENQSQLTMSGVQNEAQIKAKKTSVSRYISVPSDPEAHQPCPICQERFDTGFNQDIQDWVWLDAVRVGAKIYHATCFADLKRDGSEMREKTATPESILGKRKAESLSTDRPPFKKAVLSVQSQALSAV